MPTCSFSPLDSTPRLSIIIPVYQVELYLKECLDSILNQGSPCEIILVDDCGTDRSMDIAREVLSQCPEGITWQALRHEHNRGLSAARNTGMAVAKGDYILFVDSDDKLLDGALSAMLAAAQQSRADVIVAGIETTTGHLAWNFKGRDEMLLTGLEARTSFLKRRLPQMAWGKLLSRTFLESNKMQFLEGLIHEDELWSMQLFLNQPSTHIIPRHVYWYRQDRAGSIMNASQLEAVLNRDIHKMRILHAFVDLGVQHGLMDDELFDDAIASWEALMLRGNSQIALLGFYRQYRYFGNYIKLQHPILLAKRRFCVIENIRPAWRRRSVFLKRVARICHYCPRFVSAFLLVLNAKGKKYGRTAR